jgi:kynurenine formamidase
MANRRFIDLSMEVFKGMVVYPGVTPPFIGEFYSHEEFAQITGTDQFGITHCNSGIIVMGDHVGTHIDSWWHANPDAPGGTEAIPVEYCYGDGVVLDLTHKGPGDEIGAADLEAAAQAIDYQIKPLDIVLIRTDASKMRFEQKYLTDHPGMTREGTLWLLDQGVKLIGIDAIGFDPPVKYMFERKKFWEAHRVMREREYYHIENLINLDQIPVPYGFTVSALPVRLRGATAAPIRAVAIIEDV